jgi:hypothetical protein
MTWDERNVRFAELTPNRIDWDNYEEAIEVAKLIFGPEAGIGPDVPDLPPVSDFEDQRTK